MNLADMLSYADIGQLSRIATTYRCECNGNSKNELIQSILAAIMRKDVFEAQISAMRLEDLRFMNSLLFDPRDAFSLEELIARIQMSKFGQSAPEKSEAAVLIASPQQQAQPESKGSGKRKKKPPAEPAPEPGPRETISRFKHYGWLFNGYSGPDRYLFQMPADLKVRFKDALERRFASQIVPAADEPAAYRDEQQLMGDDVQKLLTYIHHHDIPLTSEGSMYKRSILQILDGLGVKEQLPTRGEWRFGYGRRMKDYPNRLSLLYDYCYFEGWLSENDGRLTLTAAGQERQAQLAPEAPDKLYRFWLRLYKTAIPNVRAIAGWVDKLAKAWITAESLKQALTPFIKPYYYDPPETILEQRIVGMMLHLGMLRLGEHGESGLVVRMTPLGRSIVAGLNIEDDAIVLE
ncbi:hypothetical protein [Paenibacillus humicola]|uniref:hypothetical protein n=1 Tax=Paenibacillus humicola TaxID=3110540 RepID=UPI00237BF3B6|nr:hypothetical protein [Paenibacillus humicola]